MWNRHEEEQEDTNNSNVAGFLLGALTGALVGAGVALLFAPKTGKKMRTDLLKTYQRTSAKVSDFATDAIERAAEVADGAAESVREVVDQGRKQVNHVLGQVERQAANAKSSSRS
jgi:gas vesicle protein